ncbi:MAG: type III-B CRISPR module-associated protein Cmr5 [Leptospiraceae bacterium]|nr:MAG: type III-B CRISPR module-associated protein Cmr5 [Leptospiraceae bacterium]
MQIQENNAIQKIEKGRAEKAYQFIQDATQKLSEKDQKLYKSYIKKIPSMILNNGLGQTIAFIYSKRKNTEKNPYDIIYEQFNKYLQKYKLKDNQELTEFIISIDSKKYRLIQQELLALLNWMRRFAEGMIQGETNEKK